jgi:cell division protein FtsQ
VRNPLRRGPATRLTTSTTSGSMPAVPDQATMRSRRRFARRQWRRRWLAWRTVIVLAAVAVLIVLVIWALYFSSWLSVKAVDVKGAGDEVSVSQVERAAAVPLGKPLLTSDLSAIRQRVLTVLPAVESVDVSREWPDKVLVSVTQRTPVAVIQTSDGLHALDAHGQIFLTYKQAPKGLPAVQSASSDPTALAQGAQVASALPAELTAKVDHLQIFTQDHIQLSLRSGATVEWGSAADSALKVQVLGALMKSSPQASLYDVSVPGAPATR